MDARNSNVFREIHKNTWLKRLSVDNKKVLVGPKKSERSWVVFCVHDDSEAILEGYVEPRQAAQHQPEWTVPLQHALHVSHSLVPSEHEYEFVVTLPAEVVRFNAPTWDVMLEWVDTLRQKLREMKIMSPKENLYSRLPELRAPLLPTRDPQSPLPAPPPVPAALVPGIERILPATATATTAATTSDAAAGGEVAAVSVTGTTTTTTSAATCPASITSSMPASAMSNTLTQNLINMLSNPVVSAYNAQPSTSHHHHHENSVSLEDSFFAEDDDDDDDDEGGRGVNDETANNGHADDTVGNVARGASDPSASSSSSSSSGAGPSGTSQLQPQTSMARIFVDNVLADPNTCLVKEHVDAEAIGRGATPKNRHPAAEADTSGLNSIGSTVFQSEPIIIPRPQTSRSSAREKAPAKRRVVTSTTGTAFKTAASPVLASVVPTDSVPSIAVAVQPETVPADSASASASNITIIQVSSPHIKPSTTGETFQFPSGSGVPDQLPSTNIDVHDDQFTSNVHIIPSNPTAAITQPQPVTTVQVSGATVDSTGPSAVDSGYGQLKQIVPSASDSGDSTATNVTNVTTGGASLLIGSSAMSPAIATIAPTSARPLAVSSFGGTVTHIPIGDHSLSSAYEPLFVATARPPAAFPSPKPVPKLRTTGSSGVTPSRRFAGRTADQRQAAVVAAPRNANTVTVSGPSTSTAAVSSSLPSVSDGSSAVTCSSSSALHVHSNNNQTSVSATMTTTTTTVPTPSTSAQSAATATTSSSNKLVTTMRENLSSPLPVIRKLLTRGLTDMSITRPSRSRDPQSAHVATASPSPAAASAVVVSTSRLAVETPTQRSRPTAAGPAALASEQRRRSSSHSEAQRGRNLVATGAPQQQRSHNNGHNNLNNNSSEHQQSQQMHRSPLVPKHAALTGGASGAGPSNNGGGGGGGSRMTLREQQVLELRKEMRHLGGVRIQLRRKDCQGSIALCDAFGAVWVCGWKQKDHPILYYALHIGDQVVQVAGCTVACTADVQRIIRNVQGLYIDFILRRLPFGRVYAIRRDMENQCLGLIRDGNTATIVDVVPKSLSARHGLPPKAPSCDGLSLTFWVLTEINGRPLNLFFKDTEVRDRLNASGRDISVLVQPADLIAKLKKHLKSMRGYKDYIVQ